MPKFSAIRAEIAACFEALEPLLHRLARFVLNAHQLEQSGNQVDLDATFQELAAFDRRKRLVSKTHIEAVRSQTVLGSHSLVFECVVLIVRSREVPRHAGSKENKCLSTATKSFSLLEPLPMREASHQTTPHLTWCARSFRVPGQVQSARIVSGVHSSVMN